MSHSPLYKPGKYVVESLLEEGCYICKHGTKKRKDGVLVIMCGVRLFWYYSIAHSYRFATIGNSSLVDLVESCKKFEPGD